MASIDKGIPEVAARLAKYEALKRGDPNGSLHKWGVVVYGEKGWIDLFLADLRALLAEHASLTAERDRLAGALAETRLIGARLRNRDVTATVAGDVLESISLRAALAQPEHREESDGPL